MKYDFFKFNRKQIKKRKDNEKIMITHRDYKDLLFFRVLFFFIGSLSGISIYNLNNKLIGVLVFIVSIWMMVDTIFEMKRLNDDN